MLNALCSQSGSIKSAGGNGCALLTEVQLSGNSIGSKGVMVLAKCIQMKSSRLRILEINDCNLCEDSSPFLQQLVGASRYVVEWYLS